MFASQRTIARLPSLQEGKDVLRIWRTKVDPARVDEFYTFAREQ